MSIPDAVNDPPRSFPGAGEHEWWNPGRVPFTSDGSDDELITDPAADSAWHGAVGVFHHEGGTQLDCWPSPTALGHEVAEYLDNGTPIEGRQPFVDTDGCLCWDIAGW